MNRLRICKNGSPNRMILLLKIVLFLIPALVLFASDAVQANPAQARLCNVGLNLGGAYGRLKYFGKEFGGSPPPDQVVAITTNLANAAAEIRAFEIEVERINPPHITEQIRDSFRRIRNNLTRLSNDAGNLKSNDAPRISEIRSQFFNGIAYFYTSENKRGYVWGENCDTELLDACYHFAAAHIAAAIRPQYHHVGMMQRAIWDGIKISLDNRTRSDLVNFPPLCCNFGRRAEWTPILELDANSTWAEFTNLEGYLRGFVAAIPLPIGCGRGTWVDGEWITYTDHQIRKKGWTPIGRLNRFCRRELACIDRPPHPSTLPACDSSRAGVVIQNRFSHNGCIAQGCEGGTQRIDRDRNGKPVEPYDAIFDTYECREGSPNNR